VRKAASQTGLHLAQFARQQNRFDGDRHRQKSVTLRLFEYSTRLWTQANNA
jgi:hypothetical protein